MDGDTRRALTALARRIFEAEASVRTVAKAILSIAAPPRTTTVDISTLAVGSTTKTATWVVPVGGDYRVFVQPVVAAARVGTISAGIVPGTKTATSVDLTVVNSGPSTLLAGSLDVVIHPD